ncbi:MAG TPA: D,D-dipeptide ABC transporter permease, partial [Rubellimicrobium sp.]|nr:D,D-dipeptide ABC transporter permease [Rubellimicrobium sp.]
MTARDWLLDESPASRLQASAGRAYAAARLLLRNPLAVVGGAIVLLLILTAALAPLIAPES